MPISGGYMGQILAVNVTDHSISEEPLPDEETLRKFVGGTGLGLYYLRRVLRRFDVRREEQQAEGIEMYPMDAWDEEAPLILMTGPLTGTDAPCSSDYTTVCINLEVPYAAGVGHSHGFWGPYLKFAGYDGIVIEGRSDRHIMLVIDEGRAEIQNADHLWGARHSGDRAPDQGGARRRPREDQRRLHRSRRRGDDPRGHDQERS